MADDVLSPGTTMRAFREMVGWDQAAMARYLGVTRQSYSRIELGKRHARRSVRVLFEVLRRDYREGRLGRWPDA